MTMEKCKPEALGINLFFRTVQERKPQNWQSTDTNRRIQLTLCGVASV
jgi:hypothetical protein